MNSMLQQFLHSYKNRWWVPFTTSLLIILLVILINFSLPNVWLAVFGLIAILASLISMSRIMLKQLLRREFKRGLINLFVICISSLICIAISMIQLIPINASRKIKNFGEDIVIPKSMHVIQPITNHELSHDFPLNIKSFDPEARQLIESTKKALLSGSPVNETINVDASILDAFTGAAKERLIRHLSVSAKWQVTTYNGKLIATRRFVENHAWKVGLYGFYSEYLHELISPPKHVQYRIALNLDFDGQLASQSKRDTVVNTRSGPTTLNIVDAGDQGMVSNLLIHSNNLSLEIYEQTQSRTRHLTSAAIKLVEDELKALLASETSKSRGFDASLMPQESIRDGGKEKMTLSGEGGRYSLHAYINPGEPGYIYLKAFEATQNIPLSVDKLKEATTRYPGWSDNPKEYFLSITKGTIYEGTAGTLYPARIEIWFVPQSGSPERKLNESIYYVEGWQR